MELVIKNLLPNKSLGWKLNFKQKTKWNQKGLKFKLRSTPRGRKNHHLQCHTDLPLLNFYSGESVYTTKEYHSLESQLQSYHRNLDICCPLIPMTGFPWCPVIQGDEILRAQAITSNFSRVVDQACALCKLHGMGSNPRLRPVHYQEVRSSP